jgi:hypothetical protein
MRTPLLRLRIPIATLVQDLMMLSLILMGMIMAIMMAMVMMMMMMVMLMMMTSFQLLTVIRLP